jgi:hypothetical protein
MTHQACQQGFLIRLSKPLPLNAKNPGLFPEFFVRVEGLEPTHLTASDPKSDASANFATPADKKYGGSKSNGFKRKLKTNGVMSAR